MAEVTEEDRKAAREKLGDISFAIIEVYAQGHADQRVRAEKAERERDDALDALAESRSHRRRKVKDLRQRLRDRNVMWEHQIGEVKAAAQRKHDALWEKFCLLQVAYVELEQIGVGVVERTDHEPTSQ